MPAGTAPKGDVVKQDVKQTEEASSYHDHDEVELPDDYNDVEPEGDDNVELEMADVQELEQKPIPYNRFREVNNKAKELERERDHLKSQHDTELQQLTRQYEARLAAKEKPEGQAYEYETEETKQIKDLSHTIHSLSDELSSLKTSQLKATRTAEIDKLSSKYEKADPLAVQGWATVMGKDVSLEDLMAKSHEQNTKMIQKSITDLINQKKAKSKRTIPPGRVMPKLSEDERPKSFREATRMAKQYLKNY